MDFTTSKVVEGNKVQFTNSYNLGSNLQEAVQLFGEDVVYSQFKGAAVVTVQALVRRFIENGKSQQEAQAALDSYKLGKITRVAKDPVASAISTIKGLDHEAQKAALARLRAELKAMGA